MANPWCWSRGNHSHDHMQSGREIEARKTQLANGVEKRKKKWWMLDGALGCVNRVHTASNHHSKAVRVGVLACKRGGSFLGWEGGV